MTPREHALLARELIEACGGLDEAKSACRVGKTLLSNAQNPAINVFLAADVIACLESYCGQPIYSRALFERFNEPVVSDDLKDTCSTVTEDAAALQRLARETLGKGFISPRDLDALRAQENAIEADLEHVRSVLRGAESPNNIRPINGGKS